MFQRLINGRAPFLPVASILVAAVAFGCLAAPGSSAIPGATGSPVSTPTAQPSAPPSASESPSPAVPFATPSPSTPPPASPTPTPKPTPAPCGVTGWETGARDLILRVTVAGGFVPPGVDQGTLPVIAVYGDGRAISPVAQIMIYPGPLLPSMQVRVLNDAGMRRLLEAAAKAGLLVPDVTYQANGIADAPTTFFTLTADGCTHRVSAYALMESVNTTGLDPATNKARAALLAFSNALTDLATLVNANNLADAGMYEPTGYRIISREEPSGTGATASPVQVVAWPLPLPLATFGKPIYGGAPEIRCGAALGADAGTLAPLFVSANTETRWSSGGKTYVLQVRPLLPDESSCDDPIF